MIQLVSDRKVFLGTSGWSYKEWVGPFYNKTDKSMLRAYSNVFGTVEIDSTFYRYPSKGTAMGWARYSPDDFVYSAKLPGLITHEKKLDMAQGIETDLTRFIKLMEPLYLGGKLGCILIQLPPRFSFSPEKLEQFFKVLPTHINFAVEFRHKSWMRHETWDLLENYKVTYTNVDEPLLPPEVHITSGIAYFRWHGRGSRPWFDYRYPVDELKPWVPKVQETTARVDKVYGYFNNHFHGYAVENCLQVMEMLGVMSPKQSEAKSRIEKYFQTLAKAESPSLVSFIEPKGTDFENLLRYFVPAERLRRAEEIKETELMVERETDQRIEAKVKDYHVVIDLETKTIIHDCADWPKISATKKLCKHVARLLLSIDRKKATKILQRLYGEKDEWHMKN